MIIKPSRLRSSPFHWLPVLISGPDCSKTNLSLVQTNRVGINFGTPRIYVRRSRLPNYRLSQPYVATRQNHGRSLSATRRLCLRVQRSDPSENHTIGFFGCSHHQQKSLNLARLTNSIHIIYTSFIYIIY